jgi:hypothetical protein
LRLRMLNYPESQSERQDERPNCTYETRN